MRPPHRMHVSLLAVPEAMPSTLTGLHDTLAGAGSLPTLDPQISPEPFQVEIVGAERGTLRLASGLPLDVPRSISDVARTDVVILPSLLAEGGTWTEGRYPELVAWLSRMHSDGALLCSACSGLLLLSETGLFDGREATIHWGYADGFREARPGIRLSPEKVLVVAGERGELVTSGAATSWHDLALYLIGRFVGPTAAQAAAHFYALQWHVDGLAPYMIFDGRRDHGDAAILDVQRWIAERLPIARPVEEMTRRSGLAERSFKRRFTAATGHSPIAYVQRLRIEEAKRRLERTDTPTEEIGWAVGYEDPASFRRLFKRIAGVSPATYRRRFQAPPYADPGPIHTP